MATTYRLSFLLGLLGLVISVAQIGYLGIFVSQGTPVPHLEPYGGSLLAYLVSGTVFMGFVSVALSSFQQTIRTEQQMGTLPYLLVSNSPVISVLLLNSLWTMVWTLVTSGVLLGAAIYGFRAVITVNVAATVLVLLLSTICLGGIGLASAGIVIVTHQGDPMSWAITTLAGFASGVVFPVEVLPRWLQVIGQIMPTTYALSALRKALLAGNGIADILPEIRVLLLMAAITVPAGLLTFRWGFRKARVAGSLADY